MLVLGGLLVVAMGIYFVLLRPALLPKDLGYMGSTLQNAKKNIPGLLSWLQKVFWVMGGYIFTTGLLIIFMHSRLFGNACVGHLVSLRLQE